MEKITISAIQMNSKLGNKKANFEKIRELIKKNLIKKTHNKIMDKLKEMSLINALIALIIFVAVAFFMNFYLPISIPEISVFVIMRWYLHRTRRFCSP